MFFTFALICTLFGGWLVVSGAMALRSVHERSADYEVGPYRHKSSRIRVVELLLISPSPELQTLVSVAQVM